MSPSFFLFGETVAATLWERLQKMNGPQKVSSRSRIILKIVISPPVSIDFALFKFKFTLWHGAGPVITQPNATVHCGIGLQCHSNPSNLAWKQINTSHANCMSPCCHCNASLSLCVFTLHLQWKQTAHQKSSAPVELLGPKTFYMFCMFTTISLNVYFFLFVLVF